MGEVQDVDKALTIMTAQINNDIDNLFILAHNQNEQIVNGSSWEMNERAINNFALKIMEFGLDSINNVSKNTIAVLANKCPYVGGSAVYKARALNGIINPNTHYNDRVLCINTAAAKTSQNGQNVIPADIDIDSLNQAIAFQQLGIKNYVAQVTSNANEPVNQPLKVLAAGAFEIYPNPASSIITIYYSCLEAGNFQLFNAIGQLVFEADLPVSSHNKVNLQLPNLVNGLYHYKAKFKECNDQYGKLSIIQ